MSNPPAGWYPDPTGRPNTIRWWNGTQWTNKTEQETDADGEANQPDDPGTDDTGTDDTGTDDPATDESGAADTKSAVEGGAAEDADVNGEGAKTTAEAIVASTGTQPAWTQPDQAEPEPTQSQFGQSQAGQSESGQSEPFQSQAGTSAWQTGGATQIQQQETDTPWQQSGQGWSQEPDQGWSQGRDQAWSHGTDQAWSQDPAQQTSAQISPQVSPGPADQWQSQSGWQQPWQEQGQGQTSFDSSAASQPPQNQWQTPEVAQQPYPQQPYPPQYSQQPVNPPLQSPDPERRKGSGPRTPLVIAGAVTLVLIVAAGVFLVLNRGDDRADPVPPTTPQPNRTGSTTSPGPSQSPGQSPGPSPTGGQNTIPAGQSRNPELHEGNRISSDAISFPRQKPPWSDRKRFAPQVVNSSGQYVLLQENFDGESDWYADIFVGGLNTSVLFNGDPQATASDLAVQLRSSLYGDIPIKAKPLRNGAVKRSGKSGWYYQQTITANSSKVAARTLTLTVAVFNLGDGTAVAYISDIPTNRADLKAAEAQVYKGINVG
jgi:hypothetical protein